jgi:LacI family transcriptional regulator
MPRIRIADVAAAAGVSPTTASHALTGRRAVSAATLEKVRKAAEELNYRANAVARSLRTQRTDAVALIVPDITNPFYPMVARGVQDALSDAGYQVIVCSTDADPARELRTLRDMVARAVDGMIVSLFRASDEDLAGVAASGIPFVMLGPMEGPHLGDRVMGDDRVSVSEATRHLLAAGRKRIAFIGAALGVGPGDSRLAGYEDALLAAGMSLDPRIILRSDYSRAGARGAAAQLIGLDPPVDAIICANDLTAIGVMDALKSAGLSVPSDVAVVGFDDIDTATLVSPALTTVDNRAYDKGVVCGRILLQRMSGELTGEFRRIVVPGHFIVRESG